MHKEVFSRRQKASYGGGKTIGDRRNYLSADLKIGRILKCRWSLASRILIFMVKIAILQHNEETGSKL